MKTPGSTPQSREVLNEPPNEGIDSKVMDSSSGNGVVKESRECQDRKAGHDGSSTFARGRGVRVAGQRGGEEGQGDSRRAKLGLGAVRSGLGHRERGAQRQQRRSSATAAAQ
jgi:hypothetical protein